MTAPAPEASAFQRDLAGQFELLPHFFSSAPGGPGRTEKVLECLRSIAEALTKTRRGAFETIALMRTAPLSAAGWFTQESDRSL